MLSKLPTKKTFLKYQCLVLGVDDYPTSRQSYFCHHSRIAERCRPAMTSGSRPCSFAPSGVQHESSKMTIETIYLLFAFGDIRIFRSAPLTNLGCCAPPLVSDRKYSYSVRKQPVFHLLWGYADEKSIQYSRSKKEVAGNY